MIASVLTIVLFAWVARALLGARELTWRRLGLAALLGIAVGDGIALTLIWDFRDPQAIDYTQLRTVSLPFQVVATMGAIVVLEVLFSRPRARRGLRLPHPLRALRRRAGITLRAWQVSRIVLRHGLGTVFGLRRDDESARSPEELARRARTALEDAGGMFIKLGQLLATRPDLLPPLALAELGRLHASASPLAGTEVERIVREETGRPLDEVFADITWEPVGSASIAQAHAARLRDGSEVVVKVRRPGLEEQVERDLAIALWLARIAERRTSWGRAYEVSRLAMEFGDTLRAELDFRIEGRHAAETAEATAAHPIVHVPRIVEPLTTARMLVMERLDGTPLANLVSMPAPGDSRRIADALCTSQVAAMLRGQRFHGDPHPGNVLVLDDGTIGLIDFGVTGRLDAFERAAVFQLLVAIRLEQPSLLHEALVSLGAVSATQDPDDVERALAQFMAAYLGPGLPPPEALTALLRVSSELGLRMPRSTTTMLRALSTLAGTLEQLSPGYPLVEVVADLGGVEFRDRLAPSSASDFLQQEWAQLGPLLRRAPRHLDRVATLLEHGRLTTRLRLFTDPDEVRVLERLLNRGLLAFLSVGIAAVSVVMLAMDVGPVLAVGDLRFLEVLGWTGLFLAVVLLLRVLLDILRTERGPPRP